MVPFSWRSRPVDAKFYLSHFYKAVFISFQQFRTFSIKKLRVLITKARTLFKKLRVISAAYNYREGKGSTRWGLMGTGIPTPSPPSQPQGADPHPISSTRVKAGRNHSNEKITLPPHWERRAIQSSHIKFRTCRALAPM
jgi:hypothetical protein